MNLNGKQKSAYLLFHLDTNISSQVLRYLNQQEMEDIVFYMSNLKKINIKDFNNIIDEYINTFNKKYNVNTTANIKLSKILKKAIGKENTNILLNKLESQKNYCVSKKHTINDMEPKNIFLILEKENPKIIAIILINLRTELASQVLSIMKDIEQQANILLYIASYYEIPELSKNTFYQIIHQLFNKKTLNLNKIGGTTRAANILELIVSEHKKDMIKIMIEKNTVLANKVINKAFLFENIINIKKSHINELLKFISIKNLSIAFYNSNISIKNKFLKKLPDNISKEMQNYFDKKKSLSLMKIKEKQKKILYYLKKIL